MFFVLFVEDQQNLEEAGLLMLSTVHNNPAIATPAGVTTIGTHGVSPQPWHQQHDSSVWGLRKSNLLRRQVYNLICFKY